MAEAGAGPCLLSGLRLQRVFSRPGLVWTHGPTFELEFVASDHTVYHAYWNHEPVLTHQDIGGLFDVTARVGFKGVYQGMVITWLRRLTVVVPARQGRLFG